MCHPEGCVFQASVWERCSYQPEQPGKGCALISVLMPCWTSVRIFDPTHVKPYAAGPVMTCYSVGLCRNQITRQWKAGKGCNFTIFLWVGWEIKVWEGLESATLGCTPLSIIIYNYSQEYPPGLSSVSLAFLACTGLLSSPYYTIYVLHSLKPNNTRMKTNRLLGSVKTCSLKWCSCRSFASSVSVQRSHAESSLCYLSKDGPVCLAESFSSTNWQDW